VNYHFRSGSTKVDLQGTELMPQARGTAKVESHLGRTEINVEVSKLDSPQKFGHEYLTYVLWAISPEGRSINLGEVLVGDNHRSKLDVTTDLQAFALVMTAEPYYAVRQPSNVVVLENVIREDTKGSVQAINTKYELMERGGYIPTGYKFDPVVLNTRLPLEFFEARNALRIAESEGAATYATDSYQRAVKLMDKVDGYATSKHTDRKVMIATAREAVQTAEDARAIAVKTTNDERLANERRASAREKSVLQDQADYSKQQKDQALNDTANAQMAKADAESDAAHARRAKEQAESDASIAQQAKIQAESDTAKARAEMLDAQSQTSKAKSDMAENQAASARALSAAQIESENSRLAAEKSSQNAQRAEADKATMRAQLSEQLNKVLQTRETARGLVVSMSDVLFDTGKYSLKPGAREKLAKVAGILLAYPGLDIEVGGYTDNVGGDAMNQILSENRARSVRDYLVEQGVATASVTARGFGNTLPVATNANSTGRQQNRRVELLVSGEAIGNPTTATTGNLE